MIAALYVRVSTSDQDCGIQKKELADYIARRGWSAYAVYEDHGVSGAKAKRPALDRLMADARMRRFDAVVVLKMDRFGRSVLNLTQSIAELDSLGVRFIATSQGIDTDKSNPTGRFMLNILASVAEFERELICERVRAGVQAARDKGTPLGRRKRVFDRQKARDMRTQGMSIREIAAELDVPPSTVMWVFRRDKENGTQRISGVD